MSNTVKEITEIVIVHLLDLKDRHPITDAVWIIQMPSRFDYLKDVYIILIQQMQYNSHKQRLHK